MVLSSNEYTVLYKTVVVCKRMSRTGKSVREKVFIQWLFPLLNPAICLSWTLHLEGSINAEWFLHRYQLYIYLSYMYGTQ